MYFFDLDGTLLDSNGIWLDIDIEFLGQHGVSPVPEDYTHFVTHNGFEAAAVYTKERFRLSERPEEIIAAWQRMALEHYAHRLPLKPGAMPLLQALSQRGEPMAIITSCIPHLCRAALEHHGIDPLFRGVYYSAELGMEKSDPNLYAYLSQLWELPPEECILFDDAPKYCAAAKEAGWQVYVVHDALFQNRAEGLKAQFGAEFYLDNLSSYIPFL